MIVDLEFKPPYFAKDRVQPILYFEDSEKRFSDFKPLIPQVPELNPLAGNKILEHVEELGLKTGLLALLFKRALDMNLTKRQFLGASYRLAAAAILGGSKALELTGAEASQEYLDALYSRYERAGWVIDHGDPQAWTSTTFLTMNEALWRQHPEYGFALGTQAGHDPGPVYDAIAGENGFPTGVYPRIQRLYNENVAYFNKPEHKDPDFINFFGLCPGLANLQCRLPKPRQTNIAINNHLVTPESALGVQILDSSGDIPDNYADARVDKNAAISTLGFFRENKMKAVVNIPYAFNDAGGLFRLPGGERLTWARRLIGYKADLSAFLTTGFSNDDRLIELPFWGVYDLWQGGVHYDGNEPLSPRHQKVFEEQQIYDYRFEMMRDKLAYAISHSANGELPKPY